MTEGAWDETLGEKQHPPVVSAQTHTLTHTLSKDKGAVIPKEKGSVLCGVTTLKTFFLEKKKCSEQTNELFRVLLSTHSRNLPHYFVTIHNLIYLTWFKSNQTGAISTSTFWEN